jgi:hypothetical protein
VGWWVKCGGVDELAVMQAQMLEKAKQRFEQRLAESAGNEMAVETMSL